MSIMQHTRERAVAAALAAIAIVFVLSYLKSCTESHAPPVTPTSSANAPAPASTIAGTQAASSSTSRAAVRNLCASIPLTGSTEHAIAQMGKCLHAMGKIEDADAAKKEAEQAEQSRAAWATQQKRAAQALANIGVPPATTSASAATSIAPASAGTAALPSVALTPPPGVRAGMVTEQVQARNQFGQWVTLHERDTPASTLTLSTPPTPAGASGERLTTWVSWIKTAVPVQTVTLHAAGGSARVTVHVDAWTVTVSHSDAWTTTPDQAQQVITLAAGWHRVTITSDQFAGARPTSVELQLGSENVDPVVPIPWAAPHQSAGVATANQTKPVAPATTAHPTPSGASAPATSVIAPTGPRAIPRGKEPVRPHNKTEDPE